MNRAQQGVLLAALASGCGGGAGSESAEPITCGDGTGYRVAFCGQVPHYEAGFGVVGADEINVECIAGPKDGVIFEAPDGTYHVAGTYKLTTFTMASIEIAWGGTTSYSAKHDHRVAAPGDGTFAASVTKIGGGNGNMFLRMTSGSMWMFDLVPVNAGCNAALTVASGPRSGKSVPHGEVPTYDPFGD